MSLINNLSLTEGVADRWYWEGEREGAYSVKEAYVMLTRRCGNSFPHRPCRESLTCIWKAMATMKAKVAAWRLLWNRLPTKDNVGKRIALDDEAKICVVCGHARESAHHVFLECG